VRRSLVPCQPPLMSLVTAKCAAISVAGATFANAMDFQLETAAFPPNGPIPDIYTCEGEDVPPPLAWSGAPAGTKSFALIVDDPDAPGGTG
jgi:phosphatidylethanolamine-binding protein (PEBP) family uncharacterized protein